MAKSQVTYDVFISHALSDTAAADKLAHAFRNAQLAPFLDRFMEPADHVAEIVWEALAESAAVVAIISPKTVSQNLALEIGAARAWNKPVYLYLNGPPSTPIPPEFASFEVFSQNRVDDLIAAIVKAQLPLSADHISTLGDLYDQVSLSVDTLASSPAALDKLTRQFNKKSGTHLSGENLLRGLIRLRKQGKLPRTRKLGEKMGE